MPKNVARLRSANDIEEKRPLSGVQTESNICRLPGNLRWNQIIGAGILGGIGFTMSIFITLLAFYEPAMITSSKLAIIVTSLLAALAGLLWLRLVLKQTS